MSNILPAQKPVFKVTLNEDEKTAIVGALKNSLKMTTDTLHTFEQLKVKEFLKSTLKELQIQLSQLISKIEKCPKV
jgi:hypothetical protein